MRYLFDTNVWVTIFRGADVQLRQRWEAQAPEDVLLCAPVLAELYVGALKSQRTAQNLALVDEVLRQHEVLHFGAQEALRYAQLGRDTERTGFKAKALDLQIAATASAHGLILVTHDIVDFGRIPGIQFEDWQTSLPAGGT
jgi:tRNA(fMet)-specific endonuclease VapC